MFRNHLLNVVLRMKDEILIAICGVHVDYARKVIKLSARARTTEFTGEHYAKMRRGKVRLVTRDRRPFSI